MKNVPRRADHITALLNAVWCYLQERTKHLREHSYPSDFFVHDRRVIESLRKGEGLTVRFYAFGTHVVEFTQDATGEEARIARETRRYFQERADAFGPRAEALYIHITARVTEEDPYHFHYLWEDVTDAFTTRYRLRTEDPPYPGPTAQRSCCRSY